jgi:transcriptional regulator NrdR family protein
MVCIYCFADTGVVNSRLQKRHNSVWRRRKCSQCQATFTTHEVVQYADIWRVRTRDGLKPFNRDLLLISLHDSLKHRPDGLADAGALTQTIINNLRHDVHDGLIASVHISSVALTVLRNFDNTAAVHYAAFHPGAIAGSAQATV